MPIVQPSVLNNTQPEGDFLEVPLRIWIALQTSFRCEDVESGKCELAYNQIKALYTAALLSQNKEEKDIWESDGVIYVRSKNKSGDDVITEIVMNPKPMLVASYILRNECASTFELSRFFSVRDPAHSVRNAIAEINKAINPYGFFAETFKKGVYRIVKR